MYKALYKFAFYTLFYPRNIFENSDAKSCILVTRAVKFLAFFENYSHEVGFGHC